MNAFVPENPTVVLQVSADGTAIIRSANNIDRNINLVLVPDKDTFDDKALNQPFNSARPLTQPVLSSAASALRRAAGK
jgi:hypothetical protein